MPHWARVDNGHWTLDIGHLTLDNGHLTLDIGHWTSGIGSLQDGNSPAASGGGQGVVQAEVALALITDLANLYSCSFLISGDRMTVYPDGSFEVHGRVDETDFRGCNFLMERD